MPDDDPLPALRARLAAEAAAEDLPIQDRAVRELHAGLREALYFYDVMFAKHEARDRVSSYRALEVVVGFLQAHDKLRDPSLPLVRLLSALDDLEEGHQPAMLRPRNAARRGRPVSRQEATYRGYAAGIVDGLRKHAKMRIPEAAEWVSKRLRAAGYEVAPGTLIDWRQGAINRTKGNPGVRKAYLVVIGSSDWNEPLACAERLMPQLIRLYPQREMQPKEE